MWTERGEKDGGREVEREREEDRLERDGEREGEGETQRDRGDERHREGWGERLGMERVRDGDRGGGVGERIAPLFLFMWTT